MSLRKKFNKILLVSFFTALYFVTASCAQTSPKVTVSTTRVVVKGHVGVQGVGFTPRANVLSHLLKPDGNEYPVLAMLTDSRGEFSHDIDTLLLDVGTYELWVIDTVSGTTSNVARFEVTLSLPPPAR